MNGFETAYYVYELAHSFKAILWVVFVMLFVGNLLMGVVEISQRPEKEDEIAMKYFKKSIYIGVVSIIFILSVVNIMPSQRLLAYKVVASAEKELTDKDMSEARREFITGVINDIIKDVKGDEK